MKKKSSPDRVHPEMNNLVLVMQKFFEQNTGMIIKKTELQKKIALDYQEKIWFAPKDSIKKDNTPKNKERGSYC